MVGYALESQSVKPVWLDSLLREKFFACCSIHAHVKKNERNVFCVECNGSICQHCLRDHGGHRLVQVRRYVYHDVIRLHDMQKLVDCSEVQTYIINSARVVFLNQRPHPRPSKGFLNSCDTCKRSLQEAYRYCSIACKVDAVVNSKDKDMSSLLPRDGGGCSSSPDDESFKVAGKLEELDDYGCCCESETSSSSNDDLTVTSTMTIPPPKRIRSSRCPSPKSPLGSSRRKSRPHRSPTF